MKQLFFALIILCFASTQMQAQYTIGSTADNFNLKNVDDRYISLEMVKGAPATVIVFTCNHCPFAVKYEDRIIELNTKLAPMNVPLIAINPNDPDVVPEDSPEKMKERYNEKKFNFPYLFDEGQEVFKAFGATKTPHVFVLDQDFKVRYIGAIDDNVEDADAVETQYVFNAVNAILNGEEVKPETTKAIGCSIKVKK